MFLPIFTIKLNVAEPRFGGVINFASEGGVGSGNAVPSTTFIMEVYKVFATMSLQDLFSSPLQKINDEMKTAGNTAGGLTGKLASLGKSMAPLAIASGVLLGVFGQTIAKAAEFEQSMAGVSTMFGNVAVDTANLNDKVLDLSAATGIVATEIGGALYNALSSGIPVTEDMAGAMDFMTRSSKLAKAGFTDINTAVSTTAKILNAYKMDVSETDRVHKILMQTQNYGMTTVGELGQSLAQVTPTAAAMGVSFEQIGASLASMTAQGTPTAQATTQLNSLFAELGKTGTQAQQMLLNAASGTQYAGKSFQDLVKSGVPLNEILDMMNNYAKTSGKSLLDMFSSIDAGKAALALSGANAEAFTKNLTAMGTSADVVNDAYNKVMDTLQGSTSKLSASFSALMITVGELFIPAMKLLVGVLTTVTQGIKAVADTKFGGFILKAVAGISAFIAVATLLIFMVIGIKMAIAAAAAAFGTFVIALSACGVVGSVISGVISFITIGFYALGTAISAAIWPITLIVAALAIIGVALYIFRDKIKNIILVVKGVFAVFTSLKDGVGEIKGALAEKIEANGLVGIITTICKTLYHGYQTITEIFQSIKDIFVSIPEFFIDIFSNIDLFSSGKKLISTFADGILSVIGLPKDALMSGLSSLRNLLPFSDAKEGPLSNLTLSGERLMTTIASGVDNGASTLQNATIKAFEGMGVPSITAINTNIPDVDMGIRPVISNIDTPDYEADMAVNSKNGSTKKEGAVIHINIADISLPSVTDGSSFLDELKGIALSLGTR